MVSLPSQGLARVWLLGLSLAAVGCNQIFGIEQPMLREPELDGMVPGSSDAGDQDAQVHECLRASDCTQTGYACLFQRCSEPCAEDRDCPGGMCLRTAGNAPVCARLVDNHCDAANLCPDGTRCVSGMCLTACDGDKSTACVTGQSCSDGVCRLAQGADGGAQDAGADAGADAGPAACTKDSLRCHDNMVERCTDKGAFEAEQSCSFVCNAGKCAGECLPKAQRCSGKERQTCDNDGVFRGVETCGAICTPQACVEHCQPDEHSCNGKDRMVCTDGDFVKDQTCPFVCSNNACAGVCEPTAQTCMDNVRYSCDATGAWSQPLTCPYVCHGAACAGECVPTTKRCADKHQLQTCSADGSFGTAEPCTDQACVGGACVGSCSPGTLRCHDNAVEICDDSGHFTVQQGCVNQACVGTSCVGSCAPTSTTCNSPTSYEVCSASGTWGAAQGCGGAACSNGQCTGTCTPSAVRCKPGSKVDPQSCNSEGVWADQTACSNQACVNGSCAGVCAPGSQQCSGVSGYQVCGDNGQWGSVLGCTNQACQAGACVGVCGPGSVHCSGSGAYETCTNQGSWGSETACNHQTCVSNACTGVCAPTETRCAPTGNSAEACNGSGQWATFQICSGPAQICKNGGCAANDPFNVGYSNTSGWTGTAIQDSKLYAVGPFDAAVTSDILAINIIGSASAGASADIFIYLDNANKPGAFHARANSNLTVINGTASNTIKPVGTQLQAGSRFWLAAVFFNSAQLPQPPSANFATDLYIASPFTIGSAPPNPYPAGSATKVAGFALPFYLTLRQVTP